LRNRFSGIFCGVANPTEGNVSVVGKSHRVYAVTIAEV